MPKKTPKTKTRHKLGMRGIITQKDHRVAFDSPCWIEFEVKSLGPYNRRQAGLMPVGRAVKVTVEWEE